MKEEVLMKKDLAQYLGCQSRISEVLNEKRPLTLDIDQRDSSWFEDFRKHSTGNLIKTFL